jgi:hypothetical protein
MEIRCSSSVLQLFLVPMGTGTMLVMWPLKIRWVPCAIGLLSCLCSALFTTSSKYMGAGPVDTKLGDKVCLIFGCKVPLILGKEGEHWRLVGQAYICKIMKAKKFSSDICTILRALSVVG